MNESMSTRFWFEHKSGKRLFPYMLKDLTTRRLAYRIAESRNGNSKAKYEVQLDDIEDVFRYVFDEGYVVRLKAIDGSLAGLYSTTGRSIVRTSESDGKAKSDK